MRRMLSINMLRVSLDGFKSDACVLAAEALHPWLNVLDDSHGDQLTSELCS